MVVVEDSAHLRSQIDLKICSLNCETGFVGHVNIFDGLADFPDNPCRPATFLKYIAQQRCFGFFARIDTASKEE